MVLIYLIACRLMTTPLLIVFQLTGSSYLKLLFFPVCVRMYPSVVDTTYLYIHVSDASRLPAFAALSIEPLLFAPGE